LGKEYRSLSSSLCNFLHDGSFTQPNYVFSYHFHISVLYRFIVSLSCLILFEAHTEILATEPDSYAPSTIILQMLKEFSAVDPLKSTVPKKIPLHRKNKNYLFGV
jgi:hypothetical protein